jgi:2,4-dienoyl-CoA reductase-like NADH-dependent reductase (Old Yellow Enzyme family)
MNAHTDARVFTPTTLGPIEIRNRTVKCGTNEGMSRGGLMTDALIDFHREFAAGGVGMTTLAYCSVSSEGRTFRDQMWMRDEALPGLRRFTDAIHAEGAKAAIQLGHAGWFASPHAQTFARAMQDEDFDALTRAFADAARMAIDAGFDGIEVHAGHGYLLSQFLCPWNNRRKDQWGGSLENRARFPRQVLAAVKDAATGRAAVWPKLNMDDGFEGGLTLEEGVQVARWLEEDASVDAIQLTGGHTSRTPFYLMRGEVPLEGMIANQKHWLARLGMRFYARKNIRPYEWEEAFFLPHARHFREAVALPLMLLGGVTQLSTMEAALAEGFDFVAMGRALIRDPDLVDRMRRGELPGSRCIPCNECMVEMERGGTRCTKRKVARPAG